MKNIFYIVVIGLLVGVCAFMGQTKTSLGLVFNQMSAQRPDQTSSKYQVIGLADAVQFYYRTNIIFLDVRETNYFSYGHITGARNVIQSQIRSDATLLNDLKHFKYCVVYCNNFSSSAAIGSALLLSQLGVKNLLVYPGGWEEWEACHLPATIQNDNRL